MVFRQIKHSEWKVKLGSGIFHCDDLDSSWLSFVQLVAELSRGTLSCVVKVELSWMSFEHQAPNIPACVPQSQTIEPNTSHSQIVITSAPCRSRPIDSSRWMTTGKGQWLAAGLRSFVWCRGIGNSLHRAEDMLQLLRSLIILWALCVHNSA